MKIDIPRFKIVLIGNTRVGKSSFLYYFLNNKQMISCSPTIGADYGSVSIKVQDVDIRLEIWDTAGHERFRSMIKMYYRNSIGCLCLFDVTDAQSLYSLRNWIQDFKENNSDNAKIVIVANKCDNENFSWQINEKELKAIVTENNCSVIYTSCVTGYNVNEAFMSIVNSLDLAFYQSQKETLNSKFLKLVPDNISKVDFCQC